MLIWCSFFTRNAQISNDQHIGDVSDRLQRQNRVLQHKIDLLRRKLTPADGDNVGTRIC